MRGGACERLRCASGQVGIMMAGEQPQLGYLTVGRIVGAHGVRGEVKVVLLTDYPERFRPGARLFLELETGVAPVEIASARPHKGMMLVKLTSYSDRNAAESLRGHRL